MARITGHAWTQKSQLGSKAIRSPIACAVGRFSSANETHRAYRRCFVGALFATKHAWDSNGRNDQNNRYHDEKLDQGESLILMQGFFVRHIVSLHCEPNVSRIKQISFGRLVVFDKGGAGCKLLPSACTLPQVLAEPVRPLEVRSYLALQFL